jgi:fibronectin-binding autotransporter adhesin
MSAINWAFGISGSWSDASKWDFGVPGAADDVTIAANGAYSVSVTTSQTANSLTFNAASSKLLETVSGALDMGGAFNLVAGTVNLSGTNIFGSVNQSGGLLLLGDAKALGSAALNLSGGEVTGVETESVGNYLSLGGAGFILDAVTGTSVDFGSGDWNLNSSSAPVVQFGSGKRKGTVVWHTPAAAISGGTAYTVDVAGGTLKGADHYFGFLLDNGASTTIAAGATIDLGGFSTTTSYLEGAGDIIDSGAAAALVLNGGYFSGAIKGAIAVEIADTTSFLSASTYTLGTTIDSGAQLYLGGSGAIAGTVVDNGSLYVYAPSRVFTLGAITGTGAVSLAGGTMVLNSASTYSGGTAISGGKISLGASGALGSGAVDLDNAEILATATLTLPNAITLRGSVTLAAATGKVLTLPVAGGITFDASSAPLTVTIGDSADKGTVLIKNSGPGTVKFANPYTVKVAYGTLKAGDGALRFLLSNATNVTVASGAIMDLGGNSVGTPSLTNAGTITSSSGGVATLYTYNTSSSTGLITGKLQLYVSTGTLTLTGADSYTGGTVISSFGSLLLGSGSLSGSITRAIEDDGQLTVRNKAATTFDSVISGAGSLTLAGSGAATITAANSYSGGTTITAGKVAISTGGALGSGAVVVDNAELLATATLTLPDKITLRDKVTLAAATGKVFTLPGAGGIIFDAGSAPLTVTIGDSADTGTVLIKSSGPNTVNFADPYSVKVAYGTLKAGDGALSFLLSEATTVAVASGAILDLAGNYALTPTLTNAGTITSSSGDVATLYTYNTSSSTGLITGKLQVYVSSGTLTLTGAESYTGGTVIGSGTSLLLGHGTASGSITRTVDDESQLIIYNPSATSLTGVISGAGTITQSGNGATTLSAANTYSGGTTVTRGEIIATNGDALGAGPLTMTGGELLASASQTQGHDLSTSGTVTIAAANATTLTLNIANDTVGTGKIYFGEGPNNGTVLYDVTNSDNFADPSETSIEVRAGTLRAGDSGLSDLLAQISGTRIDTGATLDAAGQSLDIDALTGSGVLTNSRTSTTLYLFGATNFSGVISGKYTEVDVFSNAILGGSETFTGPLVIEGGSVTLSGVDNQTVSFNSGTLVLTTPSRFTGKIETFASGAFIDLKTITAGAAASLSYNTSTHVLTVSDGAHMASLTFFGAYAAGNFLATADGSGGTTIGWQTPPALSAPVSAMAVHPFIGAMAAFSPVASGPASIGTATHAAQPLQLVPGLDAH